MQIEDDDRTADQEYLNLTGTIGLSGGTYSYIDSDKVCKLVSGTPKTFALKAIMERGEVLKYAPNDNGYNIQFVKEADSELKGANLNWSFLNKPGMNGQAAVPNFRTTQEQVNSFVPYAEYIRSGANVTGLRWSVVNPADVSVSVPQTFRMRFCVTAVWKKGYEEIYSGSWVNITAGTNPEGTIMFNEPVDSAEIWGFELRLYTYEDEDNPERYSWKFVNFSNPEPDVWINHISTASLVNGRSDYSDAKFLGINIGYEDLSTAAEAKYFINEGRMIVPGGGYTLIDDTLIDDGIYEEIGRVPAGTDMSFQLKMMQGINSEYLYYAPLDSNGKYIDFAGGAETGLNGKTIAFTFPNDLNMNVSRRVPNFRSVNEQLAEGVPYIELVTENGNIAGIIWRLVKASDTSTAITPSYRTEFYVTEYHTSGGNLSSNWVENWKGIEWYNPKPLNTLRYVRVRVRVYEDPDNPCYYQWNFYPSESSSEGSGGGGGGGCTTGFTISALVITAASLFLLRKH